MWCDVNVHPICTMATEVHKSSTQWRHTFFLFKKINWEVYGSFFCAVNAKENAFVWWQIPGHVALYNIDTNGRGVEVFFNGILQLRLITSILFLILNVSRPNLNRRDSKAEAKMSKTVLYTITRWIKGMVGWAWATHAGISLFDSEVHLLCWNDNVVKIIIFTLMEDMVL